MTVRRSALTDEVTGEPRSTRIGGLLAVVGGLLWALHAVVLALRPPGCVAEACFVPGAVTRASEDLAWWFTIAVAAIAGAATLVGRGQRSGRRLVRTGTGFLWVAVVLLVIGVAVNRGVAVDAPLWWLHDTDSLGRVLPLAGSLLIGAGLVRSAPVVGVLLIVAALAGLPYNAQDARVLLDLPLGGAWLLVGCWWIARRPHRPRVTTAG